MGGNAELTAYYTPAFADMILEAWYPQHLYKHVPKLAVVTKSLTRKEWSNDLRALEALKTRSHWFEGPIPHGMMTPLRRCIRFVLGRVQQNKEPTSK